MGSKFDQFPYRDLLRQVLDSDYRRKKMAGRHMPLATWLDALNMTEYLPLFHQYTGVEDLLYITEAEIRALGIRNGGHRAKIVSSLRVLKEKYERGGVTGTSALPVQRSSSNPYPYNTQPAPHSPTSSYPAPTASPEKLQRDLERELAGDPTELRTRPWYHGHISRQHAEAVVKNNGDFLVRDSISRPGDFVLTCRWRGTPLSFMINSLVGECVRGALPSVSYQFEEDAFSSIQQLIAEYQQRQRPVTRASGALLSTPVSRCMPLSYYDSKYGSLASLASSGFYTPSHSPKPSPFVTPTDSPSSSPEMNRRHTPWTGSHPALNTATASVSADFFADGSCTNAGSDRHRSRSSDRRSSFLDRCDSLPVISVTTPDGLSAVGEKREPVADQSFPRPAISHHVRSGSAPVLTSDGANVSASSPAGAYQRTASTTATNNSNINSKICHSDKLPSKHSTLIGRRLAPASSESELNKPAPPKPSRIPSIKYQHKPTVVVRNIHIDDDDRDYSDYDTVKEAPSWLKRGGQENPSPSSSLPSSPSLPNHWLQCPSSPSRPLPAQPQRGRRGNRLAKTKTASLSVTATSESPSQGTPVSTSLPFSPLANVGASDRTASPLSGTAATTTADSFQPPFTSPMYQFVGRSRSFQTSNSNTNKEESDYDNNFQHVPDKLYNTLPTKSSSKKLKVARELSDNPPPIPLDERGDGWGEPSTPTPILRNTTSDYSVGKFAFQDVGHRKSQIPLQPPNIARDTIIHPESFKSPHLPRGHKVLDQSVLLNVKSILLRVHPSQIATQLTIYDLDLLHVVDEKDLGLGVTSGLELLTLPQGAQLRQDAIERWECLRMFVMVTLLTSLGLAERAKVLSLWIQTCLELKSAAVGNLFSLTAVLSALAGPQVVRLTDTWLILRQNHTASAYAFDTKLRPAFVALNDGSSDLPLVHVSVPYVTPACYLLERTLDSVMERMYWEGVLDPFGGGATIDVLLVHLDTARVIAAQGELYRTAGRYLLAKADAEMEEQLELRDMLTPNFHLLLLWGEQGWGAMRRDRLDKLEQIFTLLSQRHQVPGDDGTEV